MGLCLLASIETPFAVLQIAIRESLEAGNPEPRSIARSTPEAAGQIAENARLGMSKTEGR